MSKDLSGKCSCCGGWLDKEFMTRVWMYAPTEAEDWVYHYCSSCHTKFPRNEKGEILEFEVQDPIDNRFEIMDL